MQDYEFDTEKGQGNVCSDGKGRNGKCSMLGHIIRLLHSLLGILDILGDSLGDDD